MNYLTPELVVLSADFLDEVTFYTYSRDWKAALEDVEGEDQLRLRVASLPVEPNKDRTINVPHQPVDFSKTLAGLTSLWGLTVPIRRLKDIKYLAMVETVYQFVENPFANIDTPLLPGLKELTITRVIVPNVEVKLLYHQVKCVVRVQPGIRVLRASAMMPAPSKALELGQEVSLQDISFGDSNA
ncbi:hypothetical protein BG015_000584 [Linnemannia schmuckeri]|uniref:Uncharacterized protein n=1 Tax=Linnemannia schmuckeri TaxID=64567 RepID=A0A9P5V7N5_9FUNG|nr:hypothetical protein BG015_000584 [Linnemannia schmuckeri]